MKNIIKIKVDRTGNYTQADILTLNNDLIKSYIFKDPSFKDRAIKIKQLYNEYNSCYIEADSKGLNIGQIDYLIQPQQNFGLPGFEVVSVNDSYKKLCVVESNDKVI